MMKNLLFLLFIGCGTLAYADQLAYISKENAEEAAAYLLKKKTVYLFCGCCVMQEPLKAKIVEAKAVYTGYENYWEVEVVWLGEDGERRTERLDLAYVWKKQLFGYKTLGTILGLEHDYCVKPNNWNDPKNIEKDI